MAEPTRAVFLSYASQDAEAARRICEALRMGGIEVWFDQSKLRGGDVWDAEIRRQIKTCTLFVPLISRNTQAREEGYFRLEWKLAVDRSHLMSGARAYLVPIVIDDTGEDDVHVPDKFRELQWTRLPAGDTPPAFVTHIGQLLSPREVPVAAQTPASASPARGLRSSASKAPLPRRSRLVALLAAPLALAAAGYFFVHQSVIFKDRKADAISASSAPVDRASPTTIPEQSIAVLPFVNMSSDKEQDYFSDGLTEEMIDLLGQVPELRVPARTSSFYFKGKNETIGNMAQQLKVAHLLEGSVRKAGKRLRITAQLIRADNGYQLWSQTYDRDDADIFAVQDDIAKAVVIALKVKLAANGLVTGARGTTNTDAYNQYLLGRQLYRRESIDGYHHAVDAYRRALALDPNYAAAYAELALTYAWIGDFTGDTKEIDIAMHEVERAIALAPSNATGYSVRSFIRSSWLWDWAGAKADIERALLLDPSNSQVEHQNARLLNSLGRQPEAITAQKRAAELDPLSSQAWENLGGFYTDVSNFAEADAALSRALELEPTSVFALNNYGTLRLLQGKAREALEVYGKVTQDAYRLQGIAMTEHTLGHPQESKRALKELIAKSAQEGAYQIAEAFAWLDEKDEAFKWLERAFKQRDGGLSVIKTDPLLRSLRPDPRFNVLLRELKLPE